MLISCTLTMDQYYKQTQLEAMASEKAAAEFQLEKEIKRLQEAQVSILTWCRICYPYLHISLFSHDANVASNRLR